MKVSKEQDCRSRTDGEDHLNIKPKVGQHLLSTGLAMQFDKPIRLPFININPNTSEPSYLQDRNRSLNRNWMESTYGRKYSKPSPDLANTREVYLGSEQKPALDYSLQTIRNNSPRKSLPHPKPKVKKVFPQIFDNFKESTQEVTVGYRILQKLGEGSYAKVYRAIKQGQEFAIKVYMKERIKDSGALSNIKSEIEALKKTDHVNIIKFKQSYQTPSSINIVTEIFQGKSLFRYLKTNNKIGQRQSKDIFRQLMNGMKHLHNRGIFHRDIKLQNILIDHKGLLKLIDFGFATQENGKMFQVCGTKSYIAPQIIAKNGYHAIQTDIWSCGVVLFKLVVGNMPFKGASQKQLYNKIVSGDFKIPSGLGDLAKELINKMLVLNPPFRLQINKILKHPWLEQQVQSS